MKPQFLLFLLFCVITGVCFAQTGTPPRPPLSAPKEAKLFNGKWYATFYEKVSWHTARDKCKKLGGQLVVIPNADTWNFVKTLPTACVWLGATDEKLEGKWVWVDGTDMTFTAWNPAKPNNYAGKDHYLATTPKNDHKWEDLQKEWDAYDDQQPVGYICEWVAR